MTSFLNKLFGCNNLGPSLRLNLLILRSVQVLGDDLDLCPKGIAFPFRKGFWAALADMCLLTQRRCKGLKPENPNQDSWCLQKMDSFFISFTDTPAFHGTELESRLRAGCSDAFAAPRSELEHQQILTIGMAFDNKAAGKVLCVIDVAQSVGRIIGLGAASTQCDYGRIARINKRAVTNREKQICASSVFGIMLQTELLIGAMASSISTCSGALNVAANCVANVAVFNGALSVCSPPWPAMPSA